jgi:UDP-GlcNAc3NAcA epimerase
MAEGFRPENSPPYTIDNPKIYFTGDIMYDNSLFFASLADKKKLKFLEQVSVESGEFALVTIHRELNTDDVLRLNTILNTLRELAEENEMAFVMPLHPRTTLSLKNNLGKLYNMLISSKHIRMLPPVSYLEMTLLEKSSRIIITDSGGVQKESHFFKKPCIVLRKETEWVELVKNGTAKLADADAIKIKDAFRYYVEKSRKLEYPGFYGDGKTAEYIVGEILQMFE